MNNLAVLDASAWLDRFPAKDGIALVSEDRPFAHSETDYDTQYEIKDSDRSGRGIVNILQRYNCDLGGPILELGCGTGFATIGLCQNAKNPWLLVTDSSTAFVNIVKRKISRLNMASDRVRFAIVSDSDLDRLPEGSISAIVLRSVVHHFLDVPGWLKSAARSLRAGGVIFCEEPCASGFLSMGLIAQAVAENHSNKLSADQRTKVQLLADTMKAYHRRDIDKSTWEDKHVFRPEEMSEWAHAAGLRSHFLANVSSDMFSDDLSEPPANMDFIGFFQNYMRYCMNFCEKDAARIGQAAEPLSRWIVEACAGAREPHLTGIFVLRKPAVAPDAVGSMA